jgi:superfamily II DNA helicase RecQ
MAYAHFQVPAAGGEQENRLNRFIAAHLVLKVERSFVATGPESFWAYSVEYEGAAPPSDSARPSDDKGRRPMVDYEKILSPADFAFYLELKEWRKDRAGVETGADGEPAELFSILTNAQLAGISEKRPKTVEDLKKIKGIGAGRIEKYGAAILELVREAGDPSL